MVPVSLWSLSNGSRVSGNRNWNSSHTGSVTHSMETAYGFMGDCLEHRRTASIRDVCFPLAAVLARPLFCVYARWKKRMSIASALRTAAASLSAVESAIGAIGNNIANARTAGFKQSRPSFVTQAPQTQSGGIAPSVGSGGANPMQVGRGVRLGQATTDFSPGSLALGGGLAQLAIQGDGMFVVAGPGGEQRFTRQGNFQLNAANELVNGNGERVLGYAVDDQFEIQAGQLTPLKIPQGRVIEGADGFAAMLVDFSIAENGTIHGKFSDGFTRDLGQIPVAQFANPQGLVSHGGGTYSAGVNSGSPTITSVEETGAVAIRTGATELSNTDIGENLVALTLASLQFKSNAAVIRASEEVLDGLTHLWR